MRKYLAEMLYALTSAYSRKDYDNVKRGSPPETNIGKLFSVFSWGLDIVQEQADLIKLWDNLDNACGSVLDRYGANFGVLRLGTTDEFYRLAIKVKLMAQLSGGDDNNLINAAAELLAIDPSEVELEDDFPAKKKMTINARIVPPDRLKLIDQIGAALKRIVAAGVGFSMHLIYVFQHVIEVSFDIGLWSYTMPFCNTIFCGTFPQPATLGWKGKAVLRASVYIDMPLYLPRLAGTYPNVSTLGWLADANVQIQAIIKEVLNESVICGEDYCGVLPSKKVIGQSVIAQIGYSAAIKISEYLSRLCGTFPDSANALQLIISEIQSKTVLDGAMFEPPFCNTADCGEHPEHATVSLIFNSDSEVSGTVEGFKRTPARSGMTDCGTLPEQTAVGKLTKTDVSITSSVDVIPVDAPYDNVDCGTTPKSVGLGVQKQSDAALVCSAEGYPVSVPLCNTKYCGQK